MALASPKILKNLLYVAFVFVAFTQARINVSNRVSEPILPPPLPILYDYSYKVESKRHKTDFGHAEKRIGNTVTGEYRVLLPDGRTQVVTYYVNEKSGFVAKVFYL